MQFLTLADQAVQRILELSADLQIKRRATDGGSPAFRDLSDEIAAYGQVLEVLITRQQEEASTLLGFLSTPDSPQHPIAIA